MAKILLSFFDYTGNWSKPFKDDYSWSVYTFDIKNGQNILDFNPGKFLSDYYHSIDKYFIPEIGLLFAVPCTDYALSGAAWFNIKDYDGRTESSQKLVAKTKEIIDFFEKCGCLKFWAIENPMSRIHKLNTWMGKPTLKFNPCDFAAYDPDIEKSRYNKQTWLWGNFLIPEKRRLEPLQKEFPGHIKLGGKSERTKELRSITPMGFAYAFYEANKT
jgi:hypothetical protein